jgi:outer membrane protein TolC
VKLAQQAVDSAQKRLDSQLKKYDLADTTIFFLLDAQNSLTRAEAELVAQSVEYRRNLLHLRRVSGTLLEVEGLTPSLGTANAAQVLNKEFRHGKRQ